MRTKSRTVEQELARLASGEHGIVTREELLAAGITASGIKRRTTKGLLIPEYRGVYRVGHRAPSVEATYLAAVRACDEFSVLSGMPAAFLLAMIKGEPPPPEVTSPREHRVPNLLTHRCKRLDHARDTTIVKGIPVTTAPRTLVDVAADTNPEDLARMCHQARVIHGTTPAHIEAALARKPNAPGSALLRAVIRGDVRVLLGQLERRFIELLREAGLPLPVTNWKVGSYYVDCRWPDHGLTVELISYRYHGSRHAWERDNMRQREARARRDDFRTFTWADVFENPGPMLAELREAL